MPLPAWRPAITERLIFFCGIKNDDARYLRQRHCAGFARECVNFAPVSLSQIKISTHTAQAVERKRSENER